VRYGRVHSYNNYFNAPGNNYCIRAALESQVLLEKNWFENVDTPWEKFITTGAPGLISAISNVFVNVTGQADPGTDSVFTVPYLYAPNNTDALPFMVTNYAGAAQPGPPLNLQLSGTNVVLSWTTNVFPPFLVQRSDNLISWTNHTAPQIVGDQNTISEPPSQTARFYRLIR
jgi:hypothetical protein